MIEQEGKDNLPIIVDRIREMATLLDTYPNDYIYFEITDESDTVKRTKLYTRLENKGLVRNIVANDLNFPNNHEGALRYVKENSDKKIRKERDRRASTVLADVLITANGDIDFDELSIELYNMKYHSFPVGNFGKTKEDITMFIRGRKNKGGNLELLFFKQKGLLPDYGFTKDIPRILEKNLILNSLPNYVQEKGFTTEAERLKTSFQEIRDLDLETARNKLNEEIQKIQYKDILKEFVQQLNEGHTEFPEYVQSVADTLSETGYYETSVSTIEV